MNPHFIRATVANLAARILSTRSHRAVKTDTPTPIQQSSAPMAPLEQQVAARQRVVLEALLLAAKDWRVDRTPAIRPHTELEAALTDYMALASPQVTAVPYGSGWDLIDGAYRNIVKSALHLAHLDWDGSFETTGVLTELANADRELSRALEGYIVVAAALSIPR